jgi:ParB-like chromosome segregation protein Spo0J
MDTMVETADSANAPHPIPSEPVEESADARSVDSAVPLISPVNAEAWGEPGIVHRIPLGQFRILPGMDGRAKSRTEEQIKKMAESIAQEGQKTPVTYQFGEDGSVVLTRGHGRLLGMERLLQAERSWPTGPQVLALLDDATDLNAAYIAGLHDNLKRNNLTPDDMVANIERLSKAPFSLTDPQIAKTLGLDKSTISQYRKYSRMCLEVLEAVRTGRLPFRAVREAPRTSADQVKWLADLQKRADQRAQSAKPSKTAKDKAKAEKPVKAERITSSVVESAAMVRDDVAKDLIGLKVYKPTRVTATVLAETALYLKSGQNGKELVEKLNGMLAFVARTEIVPRNTKAVKSGNAGSLVHRLHTGLPGKPVGRQANKTRKEAPKKKKQTKASN